MVEVIKFSEFAAANVNTNTNTLVGTTQPGGGTNMKTPLTNSWDNAGRPATPYPGLQGFNTTAHKLEYYNGTSWIQLP